MPPNFYLTTTLPYVNARPHLGFAWEILTADFICRYHRLLGETVRFNTGTDEHGQKIYEKALTLKLTPQAYCDQMVTSFLNLKDLLNLSWTNFLRTTEAKHLQAATEIWRRCFQAGDIYKKKYQVKYCVGCELEKTESELVNGHCPLHPNQELELREEDNYFFRFSKYQAQLLKHYQNQPDFVIGAGKMSELKSFVSRGLQDFSISRLKNKMPWGVPVPNDHEQVMYVWFDALTSYISTLGWGGADDQEFQTFWPAVQICGKDNLRQQAAMWQAMLLSAGLPHSRQILVNGFITVGGQKMSKSLGNVIAPADLVSRYGREGARLVIASFPVFSEDVDLTKQRLDDFYTANLANGLGNLASRLAKLASTVKLSSPLKFPHQFSPALTLAMQAANTAGALDTILTASRALDKKLSETKPWLIKNAPHKRQALLPLLQDWSQIIFNLQIFAPETTAILQQHFSQKQIGILAPLFPRLSK